MLAANALNSDWLKRLLCVEELYILYRAEKM